MERDALAVMDFWFGRHGDRSRDTPRRQWFEKSDAFDEVIRDRFGTLIPRAIAGELQSWSSDPEGAVAQILVLDQFTRNAYRGTAQAFAGDARALAAARDLVNAGTDRSLPGVQRQFVYLPFEHAEDLGAQDEALRLFAQLECDAPEVGELLVWAQRHHDIIARFGRFPHRNAALGRSSTPQELEFLKQPGSSF
jgi:uncharacterized protein (DUF924 family)